MFEDKLIICDTKNHKLKICDLKTKEIKTLAGTGKRGVDPNGGQPLLE